MNFLNKTLNTADTGKMSVIKGKLVQVIQNWKLRAIEHRPKVKKNKANSSIFCP
jgi:hypothetical protein